MFLFSKRSGHKNTVPDINHKDRLTTCHFARGSYSFIMQTELGKKRENRSSDTHAILPGNWWLWLLTLQLQFLAWRGGGFCCLRRWQLRQQRRQHSDSDSNFQASPLSAAQPKTRLHVYAICVGNGLLKVLKVSRYWIWVLCLCRDLPPKRHKKVDKTKEIIHCNLR